MKLRKLPLPPVVAIILVIFAINGNWAARTSSSGVGIGVDKDSGVSTHRQYSHSLDGGSSVSYGSKTSLASSGSSASSSNYGGSGETAGTSKGFSSGGSSVEFGGTAEGTAGSFHALFPSGSHSSHSSGYPSSSSSSGGYPAAPTGGYPSAPTSGYPSSQGSSSSSSSSSTNIQGQHPPGGVDHAQPHHPSYTYYYQHYPAGSVGSASSTSGGWSSAPAVGGEPHEEGFGHHGSLFGDFGGGAGGAGGFGGLGGLGGLAGLKGLGILAAKGILAIKPFLILGLLFLIAIPILLLFLPIPIITVTGQTRLASARSGRSEDPSVVSYLADLSKRVLTSEECLERFLCKLPKAPEPYQKKAKTLWESYGESLVKSERVSRGVNAYFDTAKEKNRIFKCNQKFQCSNKFL